MANRRVAFARINVRTPETSFGDRPFRSDMRMLAGMGELRVTMGSVGSQVTPSIEWVARDLAVTDDDTILSGLIGFAQARRIYIPDDDAQSWLKGEQQTPEAGADDTLVPFAVDIRGDRRWVAFATAQRIRPATFAKAFQAALQQAMADLVEFPSRWEVDLITDKTTIHEWLQEHPAVVVFRRTVRFPNPVRDLSALHREMQDLHARSKKEEFSAYPGEALEVVESDTLSALLEGVEEGHVDAFFQARGEGGTRPRFNTRLASDEEWVEEFRDDLSRGLVLITNALRRYSARRAGEEEEPNELDVEGPRNGSSDTDPG